MKKSPVETLQDPKELERLVDEVAKLKPRRVLEIGSMYGGSLWQWLQLLSEVESKAKKPAKKSDEEEEPPLVVSIDLSIGDNDPRHRKVMEARGLWHGWAAETGVGLVVLEEDSTSPETVAKAQALGPYDFIFIDGGHDYETVEKDFNNYFPMLRDGGLLAVHDVAVPDENEWKIGTGTWWRKFAKSKKSEAYTIMGWTDAWGVGLVWNK